MRRKLFGLAAAAGMSLLALSGVASAQQAPYPLPGPQVGAGGATQGATTAGGAATRIPFTGSNSGELALIGVGAVAAGGALLAVSRRRRSVTPA